MNNNIIETLTRIETKLDEVIAALHAYDDNELHCEYSGLPSVKAYEKITPCVGHDTASWDAEEAERRMDIIGQNGNEGLHYGDVENKFDDYGMRVVDRDKDNNTQGKRTVKDRRKYYKPKQTK
jgi:hypothetical protein